MPVGEGTPPDLVGDLSEQAVVEALAAETDLVFRPYLSTKGTPFPMNRGHDLMIATPGPVEEEQVRELGLALRQPL